MSFVNDQDGEQEQGLGGLAGLELPETPDGEQVPARRTTAKAADVGDGVAYGQRIAKKPLKRLFLGQTAVDFWGRRKWGLGISLALVIISVISLSTRELNLGIDFEGGVAYDVPAGQLSVDDVRDVLDDNGLDGADAKVEERASASGDIIKIQIEDQPEDVRVELQEAFAQAAGVDPSEISVASVSASWGEQITRKAITALVVFLGLIAVVIAVRFEWRMAIAAIIAMLHDVVVSAGIYSIFGFEVTPPTVIAFLTILGYSLYDTIVVFDRVKENERRVAAAGLSAADLVNVSTNQVLMRSLNTSISALLPVVALLLIGAGVLGQVTLREFAIALFVGMLTGAYSSVFLATPILGMLKRKMRATGAQPGEVDHLTGEELRTVVVRGVGMLAPRTSRRRSSRGAARTTSQQFGPKVYGPGDPVDEPGDTLVAERPQSSLLPPDATTEQLLGRQARPRKKKRH